MDGTADTATVDDLASRMGQLCSKGAGDLEPAAATDDTLTDDGERAPIPGVDDTFIDDIIESTVVPPPKPASPVAAVDEDAELASAVLGADFTLKGERYLAKVVSVYDGDTLRVVVRLGGRLTQFNARMAGYDSPEMKPLKSDPFRDKTKKAAAKVRAALVGRVLQSLVFVECGDFDKYGRLLVTMYTRDADRRSQNKENLNAWMVAKGYGLPYGGGKKTEFTERDLDRIIEE